MTANKQNEPLPDTVAHKGERALAFIDSVYVCVWAEAVVIHLSALNLVPYLPSVHERLPREQTSL